MCPAFNDVLIFLSFITSNPPPPPPAVRQGYQRVVLTHHVFPVFQSSPGTAAIESGGRQKPSVSVFPSGSFSVRVEVVVVVGTGVRQ